MLVVVHCFDADQQEEADWSSQPNKPQQNQKKKNKKKQTATADQEKVRTCVELKKETIASTLQRVYREEGPLALYRGLGPELTRGALSSALMLMIKEKIQMYITLLMMIVNSA
ncbi:hypothetical protein PF005_g30772 [Phytophthora fragariae]|uniref:ADP/ATP translocase n=1 Tax=Phytophthora fragariae TaxID=53985 RepID=A0A6A3QB81_9STRA|nr:hypothetical protein PF003_g21731 [Phytophthora fragariae]KAE8918606.1 hypothetical protein PF009_g31081 [Phytophthora fragariae]KAE9072671.1 hypothetical protein PF007_g26096 [Phytophthora fragariae]KAE9162644.1 hypothetical protein PF005_g30772 [Phytophthora fragariae]